MDGMNWFLQTMKEEVGEVIQENEVGMEAVLLEKEEIGMDVYPERLTPNLPDPLLFETFLYEKEKDQYLGVVTMNEQGDTIYLCRIFKNSTVIYTLVFEGGKRK